MSLLEHSHTRTGRVLDIRGWRRRCGAVALAVGALIALAALAAPLVFSQKAVRDAVVSQIQSLSGLYVAPSELRLALLPHPHIAMLGLSLADRSGALHISAEAAYGAVNPVALATGRVELSAIQLLRPKIRIDLDQPIDAPGEIGRAMAQRHGTPGALKSDRLLLGIASIVDGNIRVTAQGRSYVSEKVDLTLDWHRLGEPLGLTGSFDWRGEKFHALVWVARPGDLLRGVETVATVRVDGENLNFEAQGPTQLGPDAHFAGRLTAAAASGRHALDLFGVPVKLPVSLANMQLLAQAVVSSEHAQFDGVKLVADGHEFEGRAAFRRADRRLRASATLKSPFVSAKAMFAESFGWLGADGQWSKEPFDGRDFAGVDMDLRLDAAHARLGRFALDDAVFIVTLHDEALNVQLNEARGYKGNLKLSAALAPAKPGLRLRADARLRGVDAGPLLRDLFGRPSIGGELDATLSFDASGSDASALLQSATGRASLALKDGQIDGLDLDQALRRLDRRPLSSALDIRAGRTVLDQGAAEVIIENGLAEFREGQARGPSVTLLFSGRADIAERTLLLTATARATNGAKNENQIAFDLGGGWDDLRLSTDAQYLIRRSDAAAPLLPP